MSFSNAQERGRPVAIKDEGITLVGNVGSIDFAGAGVTGTAIGTDVTETIGGGGVADATYITQTPNGSLSAEQALSLLATGYVKNTTGTGVLSVQAVPIPVADGGSGTSTALTTGSVVFAGAAGVYSQDNANIFWDDTNNRLGIGTAAPTQALSVAAGGSVYISGGTTSGQGNIQMGANPSAVYDSNILYLDSAAKTMGFIGGSTPAFSATNGPFIALRGNTYTAIATQRGILSIGAGSPSVPVTGEGEIRFITGAADATRMVVDKVGFVGIGTTTPSSVMHVAITSTETGIFTNSDQEGLRYQNKSATVNNWEELIFSNSIGTSSAAIAVQNHSHVTQSGSMVLATGQSGTLIEVLKIDNVGCTYLSHSGTAGTTPWVSQAQTGLEIVCKNATVNNWSEIMFRGASGAYQGGIAMQHVSHSVRSSRMTFSTGQSGTITEAMRIDEFGNVGVKTTIPLYPFHIVAPISKTTASDSNNFFFSTNEVAAGAPFGMYIFLRGNATQALRKVSMNTTNYGVVNDGILAIQEYGGTTGIGLAGTASTAKLHIGAGTATATTEPLKFTAGTNLTVVAAGAVEYDGTSLFFSPSTTRLRVVLTDNTIPSNGQLPIGNGTNYTNAALTAGSGITVTNGAGTITVASTGNSPWTEVTGTTQTIAVNNSYIANNVAGVTFTIPATAAVGDVFRVVGKHTGLFILTQAAGQTIHFGNVNTTTGAGGSVTATNRYDSIELVCTIANTDFTVMSSVGSFTIV